jgi:hypothetical protein
MHGGGCIGVRSQSGIGSTFAFFIGIRIAEDQGFDAYTRRPIMKRQQSIEDRVQSARFTVLLVEDNLINVSTFLKRRSFGHTEKEIAAESLSTTTRKSGLYSPRRWSREGGLRFSSHNKVL